MSLLLPILRANASTLVEARQVSLVGDASVAVGGYNATERGKGVIESRLDRSSLRAKGPRLIGTALYGALRRVVWDRGVNYSRDPILPSFW